MSLILNPSLLSGQGVFNPLSISGCVLWLEAGLMSPGEVDGGLVTGNKLLAWNDLSPEGVDFTPIDSSGAPSYQDNSGNPYVRFQIQLLYSTYQISGAYSMFAVVRSTKSSDYGGTADIIMQTDNISYTNKFITNARYYNDVTPAAFADGSISDGTVYKNGSTSPLTAAKDEWFVFGVVGIATDATGRNLVLSGNSGGTIADPLGSCIDMAAVVLYEGSLSTPDRILIENYLNIIKDNL